MSKEEYAQLNYLLAKIKYELNKMSVHTEHNSKTYQSIKEEIKAIELVSKICILDDCDK